MLHGSGRTRRRAASQWDRVGLVYAFCSFDGSWYICAVAVGGGNAEWGCLFSIYGETCEIGWHGKTAVPSYLAAFCFPPRHFGQEVSNSSFPIFAVLRMGVEFTSSRGTQLRAVSQWRRVGCLRGLLSSDGYWLTCTAAVGEKCCTGLFVFELRDFACDLMERLDCYSNQMSGVSSSSPPL